MEKKHTEKELREIEQQLGHPKGELGIAIGKKMDESNKSMTLNTLDFLELESGNRVLELGHGACGHLKELLHLKENIDYHGLEISETMHDEAKKNNENFSATFSLYNGDIIPYPDNYFDRIFTVNTLYFWENPIELLCEIMRVLRPNGLFIVTYAQKEFMQKLPFVADKFHLYSIEEVKQFLNKSYLNFIEFDTKKEKVESKTGQLVERTYYLVKAKK